MCRVLTEDPEARQVEEDPTNTSMYFQTVENEVLLF